MAADDSSPSCEFAWVAEESFDFVTLLTSLTAVKDAVGLKGFRGMTLAGRRDGPGMVLSFKFSTRSYSAALRKVIEREAAKLRCQPFDLLLISRSDREKLKERLAELPVTVEASGPSSEVVETFRERMGLKPSGPQTPRIRLTFDSPEALSAVYARQVAEGSVFIPSSKPPPPGQRLKLELAAQGVAEIETDAEALEPATQEGVSGFRAKLTLSEALRELVARHALQKREGRLAKGDAGQRQHPRFETFLEVAFADIPELSAEYATNISLGGLFVKA
ncbi:MAG TPA: hypothetical protein VEY30_03340, partial [Myxococcaceae bacterium]|nr:hypothetical protein [Myxococcaceae bacterium]